jgi:RHS repeat-associated protein
MFDHGTSFRRSLARRRIRALAAALLTLASLSGAIGLASAAPEPSEQASSDRAKWDGELQAAVEAAQAREPERQARLEAPAAREERRRSRTLFEETKGPDAIALAKQRFPDVLAGEVWTGLGLQAGQRLDRYLGDFAARIVRSDESRALVESTVPLRTPDDHGQRSPVELALEDRGGFLESGNPIVPVRFSKDPREGVTLERSGVGVRLAGSSVVGVEESDRLAFADALEDTDFWATPTPAGFETFAILRSAASPETLELELALPEGADLRPSPDGAAGVWRAEERIASITAPVAQDSDGQPVAVEMSVEGSRLILQVPHRESDVHYPLLVDPEFVEPWDFETDPDEYGDGWAGYTNHSGTYDWVYTYLPNRWGEALYAFTRTGAVVNTGDYGGWTFDPQGSVSYLYRAEMKASTNALSACMYRGINDGYDTKQNCSAVNYNYTVSCVVSTCDPNAGGNGNYAYMRLQSTTTSTRTDATKAISGLSFAKVSYSDRDVPSFAGINNGGTNNWQKSYAGQVTGDVTESGLGVARVRLDIAGVQIYEDTNVVWDDGNLNGVLDEGELQDCLGTAHSLCEPTLGTDFPFDSSQAPLDGVWGEGKHSIVLSAWDALGKQSSMTWGRYWIDRSGPALALSGTLWNGRVQTEPGTALAPASNYGLQIAATDGLQGGTPGQRRSGVKSVEVRVDGETVLAPNDVSCPSATTDSCPSTRNYTFSTGDFPAGRRTVEIVAKDQIGNVSTQSFDVIVPPAGELLSPGSETATSRWIQFEAHADAPNLTTVKFQYRRPLMGWQDVPQNALFNAQGQSVSTINHALVNGNSPVINWDVPVTWALLGAENGPVDVRARFSDGSGPGGSSKPVRITFDPRGLGTDDARATVGPGQVDLLTGNLSFSSTDASVSSWAQDLGVTRTLNSRDPGASATGPFGPGWVTSLPVSGAADYSAIREITDAINGNYVEVTTSDGTILYFLPKASGGYTSETGLEGLTLTKPAGDRFKLEDAGGNSSLFVHQAGTPTNRYDLVEVMQPGVENRSSFAYDANGRVSRVLAPVPAGINCSTAPLTTRGCRSLTFVYATSTTATGTAEANWGNYSGRLVRIDFTAWDNPTSTMPSEPVAQYLYDNTGKLRAAWDPRVSPALKERYSYDVGGRLSQVTPPGLSAWNLTYEQQAGDVDGGRLKSVSRATPQGTATTTIAYGVPISGLAAPYQMGASDVAAWSQDNYPVAATAIFPPDSIPASPPASYTRASVYYMNRAGREVNSVVPGGATTTSEYDRYGNVVRELSPSNRARALASGALSVQVSERLDVQRTYQDSGQEMVDQLGPEHEVKLENGQVVQARSRTVTTYDEGAPANSNPHLPTTTTTSAQVVGGPASADVRVSKVEYDWALQKPTKTIADYGGLNITRQKTYNASTGLETSSTMPKQGSRVRTTAYYTASSGPEWANLPSATTVQGGTVDSDLPAQSRIAYNSYNRLNQVKSQTKWDDNKPTTMITSYDAAGRETGSSITGPAADPAGLVAGYGFEEASGTASDMSGNNNVGTLGNGALRVAGGRFGKAVQFDGVNDRVTIPNSSSLLLSSGAMTLEAWVRPSAISGGARPILSKTGTVTGCNAPAYGMSASGAGAAASFGPRGTWCGGHVTAADSARLHTGVWSHVAVTKSGTSLKVYVNGVQVASGSASTVIPATSGWLVVGEDGTSHFAGLIDELRVYDRALSTTEIAVDMDRPVDPDRAAATIAAPLSGLKAAYGFEGSSLSTLLRDSSPLGNDGSMDGHAPGGRAGSALARFEAATVPDSPSLDMSTGITIEAWLDPDPSASSSWFGGRIVDKPGSYRLQTDELGSSVEFTLWWSTGNMTIRAPVTQYQASHVVASFNGTVLKIFVDGVLKTSYTLAAAKTIAIGTSDLALGNNNSDFLDQTIDEVRLYNRALTTTEIQQDSVNPIAATYARPPTPTALPTVTNTYDLATGLPTTTSTTENGVTKTITTGYDSLGRATSYTDADGNTSTTTYDLLGRPSNTNDGKGTQTFTYDPLTGYLTQLIDSHAGTFTASYDPDGSLASQTYPNGLRADTLSNENGSPTDLTYTKQNCSSNCVWYEEHVEESIHGQWLSRDSSLSDQEYSYDHVGRLIQVKDTPAGQGCTTRSYAYDANSNRTSMTQRVPGAGGVCDTTSTGSVQASTYDSADRTTNAGFSYDSYSRMITVPASHAGGTALKTTYYVNDMVKTQVQGAVSKGWLLDPTQGRYRATIPSGTSQEIMHYADGSDSPAWTDTQTNGVTVSWERTITGIDGGLAAIADNNGTATTTTLQIASLHGDIVGTASTSTAATALASTFESDEFGNPRAQSSTRKYGYLGSKERRTVMPSGVTQMGVRSYVPAMGRFTSTDPISGGSANDYDYANADPVNQLDTNGQLPEWVKNVRDYVKQQIESNWARQDLITFGVELDPDKRWACYKSAAKGLVTLQPWKGLRGCGFGAVKHEIVSSAWWKDMKSAAKDFGRNVRCTWTGAWHGDCVKHRYKAKKKKICRGPSVDYGRRRC